MVDISWFSWQLWRLTGQRGMAILYLYTALGWGCLRCAVLPAALPRLCCSLVLVGCASCCLNQAVGQQRWLPAPSLAGLTPVPLTSLPSPTAGR